jgi:hypothetical protein
MLLLGHTFEQTYVCQNEVMLQSLLTGTAKKIPLQRKCIVYQASFTTIWSSCFLVIATSEGLQVWTLDPLDMKYSHNFRKDGMEGSVL